MSNATAASLWKTSDIKVSKDREGFFDASHKFQGDLLVSAYCADRAAARREAVAILKEMKEQAR
jgi:hypothetical protein